MSEYISRGIKIAQSFNLDSKTPLDGKSIAENLEELNSRQLSYEGQQVFVKSEQKFYFLNSEGLWAECQGGGEGSMSASYLRTADYDMK